MYTCTIAFPDKKSFDKIREQIEIIGGFIVEKNEKAPYNPEFVKKIKESEEEIKKGEYRIINTADLWK